MHNGAVVIMDVLGFKGIWQRYGSRTVLEAMRDLETMVTAAGRLTDEREGEVWNFGCQPTYRFRFMSDTLFVGCWLQGKITSGVSPHVATAASLFLVCRLTSRLLAVATGIGFPFRGCIAAGEFDVLRNFVVGPAVDEAAEWADEADGAFVWLRPDAVELYKMFGPIRAKRHIVYPYEVPIKKAAPIRTAVVNPRGDERRPNSKRDLARLLEYFDERKPGVSSKLKNTREFFDHVVGPDRTVRDLEH